MKSRLLASLLISGIVAFGNVEAPAHAQSRISNSDGGLAEFLGARGYTDVRVTKRGFTISTMEACKNGEKFKVKVSILGQVKSAVKIGTCGSAFSPQQAVAAMQLEGYENIDARASGNRIIATACRDGRKFGLTFARNGQLINRDRLGRCDSNNGLTPRQIAEELRGQGFNRIQFTDNQLPRYVAEACYRNDRVRLELNRRGEIRTERRIGDCAAAINPNQLQAYLESKNYKRVEVVQNRRAPYLANACLNNDRLQLVVGRYGRIQSETKTGLCRQPIDPNRMSAFLSEKGYDRVRVLRSTRPYLVEACKGSNLMELTVGRFGRIRKEDRVGRCAAPLTEQALADKLAESGYFAATISRGNNGSWRVEACKDEDKMRLRYSAYGELRRENRIGSCASAKVNDVLGTLESRGASKVQMFVEGCFRNSNYRWSFDRLGNRIGRERLSGRC